MEINNNSKLNAPIKSYYLVPQSMITITEEALRLRANEAIVQARMRADLIAKLSGSASAFIGLLLSYISTSEFNDFIFNSDVWNAFFLFCILASLCLSVYFLFKLINTPKPDDFVEKIIKESKEIQEISEKAERFKLLPQPDWLVTPISEK